MNKRLTGWIWAGAGAALAYLGWLNRRLLVVNDITTGESAAYPTLRSRVYYTQIDAAMTAAEQAVKRLPGWELLTRDSDNDILEASSSAVLATDDVTLYFFALGHGQTRVTIRSRSRVGVGDLGRNASHIKQLQAAMDARLNAGAAF